MLYIKLRTTSMFGVLYIFQKLRTKILHKDKDGLSLLDVVFYCISTRSPYSYAKCVIVEDKFRCSFV